MENLLLLDRAIKISLNPEHEDMAFVTNVFIYWIPEGHGVITQWERNKEQAIETIRKVLEIPADEIEWEFSVHSCAEILTATHVHQKRLRFRKLDEQIILQDFFYYYVDNDEKLYVIDSEGNTLECDYGNFYGEGVRIVKKYATLGRHIIAVLQ